MSAWEMTTARAVPPPASSGPRHVRHGGHAGHGHADGHGRMAMAEPRSGRLHLGADGRHVVDHDDRHDVAERCADHPALRARASPCARQGQIQDKLAPTGAFAAGYLLVWLGFSIAAAALHWAARTRRHRLRDDDGFAEPLAFGMRPDRRRPVSALAAQERVPVALPRAGSVPVPPLAAHALGALRLGAHCTAPIASAAAGC